MWEVLDLSQMEASTRDKYSYIFKTYAHAFKGRRQLFWSKGLKKLLSIVETTDEELANKEELEDELIINAVVFTDFEWSIIRKLRLQAKVWNPLAHELSKAKMKFLILESVVSTLSF